MESCGDRLYRLFLIIIVVGFRFNLRGLILFAGEKDAACAYKGSNYLFHFSHKQAFRYYKLSSTTRNCVSILLLMFSLRQHSGLLVADHQILHMKGYPYCFF